MCEFSVHATVRVCALVEVPVFGGSVECTPAHSALHWEGQGGGLPARVVVLPPAGVTVEPSVTTSCTPWPVWAFGSVGPGAYPLSPGGREGASGHTVRGGRAGPRPWAGIADRLGLGGAAER